MDTSILISLAVPIFFLMIGIELKMNCADLVIKALKKRLVINVTKNNTIRLLPPLICEEKHVFSRSPGRRQGRRHRRLELYLTVQRNK